MSSSAPPLLLIHGGAGRIDAARRDAYRAGLDRALDVGWRVLGAGGTAIDAALAAVASMERTSDAFNAGVGAALTRDGTVECDAAAMAWIPDAERAAGRTTLGAVAALGGCPVPSRVADRVRRESHHALLVGAGAEAWIPDEERCAPEALITPWMRSRLERWRERAAERGGRGAAPSGTATVGAVAIGAGGDLAAVTSTGGTLGQAPGRVGDAPIAGAGTLADATCAVSCTGAGEAFLSASTAKGLSCALAAGAAPDAGLRARLAEVAALGGSGGAIVVGADGGAAIGFDTPHMAWGARGLGRPPFARGEAEVDTESRVIRLR